MKTIATALLLTAFAGSASGADNPKSLELVRAMRSDEIAVAQAKLAFLSGSMQERYGKTNKGCVKKVAYSDFTAGWAHVVDTVLTPKEIDTSLAFFKSDAGVKYVEGLLRRLRARQGSESLLPSVPGTEDITPAQVAAIADFSRTDLGKKIMGKDLTLSPAAEALGGETTKQIAEKCGGK